MRKITATALLVVISLSTFAQSNVFKIHALPFAWGEIRMGYERKLNDALSVQINFGGFFSDQVPNFLYDTDLVESYNNTIPVQNNLSGYSLSADLRIYPKLSAPAKFYIAPYIKHNHYDITLSASFDYEANVFEYAELTPEQQEAGSFYTDGNYYFEATGVLDGSINQIGIGASVGMQYIIGKHIVVDLNLFGLGIEYDQIEAELTTDIGVDYDKWLPYVENDIRDIPYIGDKVELTGGQDKINLKAPIFLPTYRGSIAIGFAF